MRKTISQELKNKFIGLSYEQAVDLAEKNDIQIRVAMRNGNPRLGTCDCKLDRLNLYIEKDLITKVEVG